MRIFVLKIERDVTSPLARKHTQKLQTNEVKYLTKLKQVIEENWSKINLLDEPT